MSAAGMGLTRPARSGIRRPACYYPHISSLELRARSVAVVDASVGAGPKSRGVKRTIGGFTHRSKNRLRELYLDGPWCGMLTLTYHLNRPAGEQSKSHLNTWLQALRWRKIRYLWVLEWQTRGFPHYHVWVDRQLSAIEVNDLMSMWANLAEPGNDQALSVAVHAKSWIPWTVTVRSNYATKYALKNEQKCLPEDIAGYGRWRGASRGLDSVSSHINIDTSIDLDGCVDPLSIVIWRQIRRYLLNRHSRIYKRNFIGELGVSDLKRIEAYYRTHL